MKHWVRRTLKQGLTGRDIGLDPGYDPKAYAALQPKINRRDPHRIPSVFTRSVVVATVTATDEDGHRERFTTFVVDPEIQMLF